MPRRKPISAKQRKAELQIKRAIKRGDSHPETTSNSRAPASTTRSGDREPRRDKRTVKTNVDASRRLESSFVKFSPEFLEEAKRKASNLYVARPIAVEKLLFPLCTEQHSNRTTMESNRSHELTVLRRPKWRYDMSKKEVENNEAALFKQWLHETDQTILAWKDEMTRVPNEMSEPSEAAESQVANYSVQYDSERMPYAPPLFERNLEVWRQLWRVTEICQVLLVLLDCRCPPLHYPPSLSAYLSSLWPPRKIIFVLTKVDISGPRRSSLWKEYLRKTYPDIRVITVESYVEKTMGEGQGKRVKKEPHIPVELRREVVQALKEVHRELCAPPPYIASDANKLAIWEPSVTHPINWDTVLNAGDRDISHDRPTPQDTGAGDLRCTEAERTEEFLSVGLIGQPNVGKSSLLNALFGSHKVKASKTPGKTKHFQTLFWSKQVRLVDCPGILPISQVPAIPSSIHYALQYLPLEKILDLQHPAERELKEDKRTWRSGMRPGTKSNESNRTWTAMDVLTAYAEKNGWMTAKAGRPDVNRAGNAILRALAEGRIKWSFYPPDMDLKTLADENKGLGIWIEGNTEDYSAENGDSEDEEEDNDSEHSLTDSGEDDSGVGGEGEESEGSDLHAYVQSGISTGTGMFGALTLHFVKGDD